MEQIISLSPNIGEWIIPTPIDYSKGAPKWLGASYPGVEDDIAKDVLSSIFWNMVKKGDGSGGYYDLKDTIVKARLVSQAILEATERTSSMQGETQRAMYKLIYLAQQTGAWAMGLYEYATLEEWLKNRIPDLEGSGEIYDIKFLLERLFPLLEQIGDTYQPANLLSMQAEWSKTRASIPYMRDLYNEYMATLQKYEKEIVQKKKEKEEMVEKASTLNVDTPEFVKTNDEIEKINEEIHSIEVAKEPAEKEALEIFVTGIQKTLNAIADPEVAVRVGERNIMEELRGMRKPERKLEKGHCYLVNDRIVFVFGIHTKYQRAVESLLKNILRFTTSDYSNSSRDLSDAILEGLNTLSLEHSDD